MKNTINVFVYGSLLSGLGNHHVLEGARFVSDATITGTLCAFEHHNGFPFAQRFPRGTIRGEVYAVTEQQLMRLDGLEGHPRFYCREFVLTSTGEYAWAYFINGHAGTRIEHGDWKRHLAEVRKVGQNSVVGGW